VTQARAAVKDRTGIGACTAALDVRLRRRWLL
jgi:hypothetical protein